MNLRVVASDIAKEKLTKHPIFQQSKPIGSVFQYLSEAGVDVDEHRKKDNLIVADAVGEFFGKGKDFMMFLVKLERKIKDWARTTFQ